MCLFISLVLTTDNGLLRLLKLKVMLSSLNSVWALRKKGSLVITWMSNSYPLLVDPVHNGWLVCAGVLGSRRINVNICCLSFFQYVVFMLQQRYSNSTLRYSNSSLLSKGWFPSFLLPPCFFVAAARAILLLPFVPPGVIWLVEPNLFEK